MVTLRRDEKALQKNLDLHNTVNQHSLTSYDLHMQKKNHLDENESSVVIKGSNHTKQDMDGDAYKQFLFTKLTADTTINDADVMYMDNQAVCEMPSEYSLKTTRQPIDFGRIKQSMNSKTSSSTSVKKPISGRNISSKGKIFLALYILTVGIAAFIILAVNTITTPSKADADIINKAPSQIESMQIEEKEQISKNWFDNLCDTLKK